MTPSSLTVEYMVKDRWVQQIGLKRQKVLFLAKMTRFSAMCAKITNVAKSSERNKKRDL
jgi:cell division inhibitor SulA